MRNGLPQAALLSILLLPGCKDKAADDKAEAPTDEASNVVAPPEPAPAPAPDAQEIPKLSETAISIFEAQENLTKRLEWHLLGEEIALRAEANLSTGATASYDARLFVQIKGSEETELHSCKALTASAQGKMDLVLRGDKLHVLCINPPQAEDPGSTEAKRYSFNLGELKIEPSGSYGGDGSLDLDTIDLDEGE
jgi:hypothetical protein